MKVIAGLYKGKPLYFTKNPLVRPMTQKVREAIFDIVRSKIKNSCMLDLFCGSGSVGIEALSRGARYVDFVDLNTRDVLKNVKTLGLGNVVHVYRRDAFRALDFLSAAGKMYDIIFAGPPYGYPRTQDILRKIDETGIMETHAVLFLEHRRNNEFAGAFPTIVLQKTYVYGQTVISRYECRA